MKILTLRGTDIHIIPSFLILMGLFVIIHMEAGWAWHVALLWIPTIFISVLLHEAGHAAAFGVLGMGPSQIVLGGFGGYTINRASRKVWQDVVVSLSGPLFSFFLAGLFLLIRQMTFAATDPMMSQWVPLMILANIVWGIFNLLPIFPMDGGQAVYGVLQYVTAPRRAMLISIWSSMILGGVLLLLGLFGGQFFLAIIVGFLLFQNYQRLQTLE
jgi:stage IV sporulation protein FB